jgi:heterodisulfide reductase subunit C2
MKVLTNEGFVETDDAFAKQVAAESGQPVESCYQCGKCTAGCPTAFAMDLAPSQVMRAAQAGLKDLALGSSSIWLCAGCSTCASRCPRDIDLSRVNKALTAICLREGRKPREADTAAFHKSFLDSVSHWGRAHEFELVGILKTRTRKMFKDLDVGLALAQHGKLSVMPERIKDARKIRRLLRRAHPGTKGAPVRDVVDLAEKVVDTALDAADRVLSRGAKKR